MNKFIEFTDDRGRPLIINTSKIVLARHLYEGASDLLLESGVVQTVKVPYDVLARELSTAEPKG
jgi:hypothetical protein